MPPLESPRIELAGIAPEVALAAGALVLLVVDAFLRGHVRGRWYLPWLATAALGVSLYFAVDAWGLVHSEEGGNKLQLAGMVALDGFGIFVKISLAVFGLLTVWLGREYLVRERLEEPEFYALLLFVLAGMMLIAAAADLIMIFLALEMLSLPIYVLVGLRRRSPESQESAMKYFLLGAFSSAFFLFGIALAYGAVGSTSLYASEGAPGLSIVEHLRSVPPEGVALMVFASGLLIVGLGFKIAAVPFHMWTPDAYQGAPSPVTGFMAAATKIAAFAALIRLLDAILFPLRWDWRPLLIAIAIATMIVGAVLAVVQEDVKRLLAYSSIAHAGFVLTGVVAASDRGVAGSLFYLATYGVTVLGAFAVVSILSGPEERNVRLAHYRGLFFSRPLLSGALTLFLLSLAGVPGTSGFVAKVLVFGPAIDSGYPWLAVIGVIASAVAAFLYLRVLVVMYMQEPEAEAVTVPAAPLSSGVVALAALATVAFGLAWGPLIRAAQDATFFFTG